MRPKTTLFLTIKEKMMKIFPFLYLFILFLSPAMVADVFAQEDKAPTQNAPQTKQTIKVKVSGITCAGDSKDIQKSVEKVNGIIECKPVGKPSATSVFEITFNPAIVSEKEIRKAVEDTPGCENPDDRPYKVKG
jgi:copper chaperone CopZ